MELLVGPVDAPTRSGYTMPVSGAAEFIDGFLHGFIKDNNLTTIQACAVDADDVAVSAIKIIEDFTSGDEVEALALLASMTKLIPNTLSACVAAGPEVKDIEAYVEKFTNKATLIATVSKNLLLHKHAIKNDITSAKSEWAAGQYYQAGLTIADL